MPTIISGSTGISGTDGTAATPAVQGTDTNTGIFFPAADTIAFAEGGTEVMRIDSNGNLGIGTSSPGHRLHISNVSPSGFATIRMATDSRVYDVGVGGSTSSLANNWYLFDVNAGATRLLVDSGGRVTMPTQPSFRVSRSNNTGVSGTVLFDNIYHNIGSHYNSGNGRFTAPVTGNYLFMATGGNNSSFIFDIRVNQGSVSRAEFISTSFSYIWQSAAVVVRMNANDFADVTVVSGTANFEPNLGSFTGYLLS